MRIIRRRVIKRRKIVKRTIKTRIPSKALREMIKKELRKNVETKHAYHASNNSALTFFNGGINSTGDMLQVVPNLSQGTADNNRIGDHIKGQKMNIKGYMRLDVNTTGSSNTELCNVVARLFVVSLKSKQNYTEASSSATPLSGLLKKGGTTVGFTGVLSDIYAPVNTDLWTVHADKRFYLNQSHLQNFNSTTNAIVPVETKNIVKFFNINVKCKKLIKYDSNVSSGLLPTNFGPMFLLGYSFLNGASPDVINTRLGTQFDVMFAYEDA